MDKRKLSKEAATLAAVTLAALALRIWGLDAQGLWLDEFWTLYKSGPHHISSMLEMLAYLRTESTISPPAFFVLMRLWIGVFGDSESMVRLPSAIMGTAAIPALYFLAKGLMSKRAALLAASLLALSQAHMQYSQEARFYPMLTLLAIISIWGLMKAMRGEGIAVYVISATLILYTHYYGIFIWVGHALAAAITGKGRKAVSAPVLLFLPWVPSLIDNAINITDGFWIPHISSGEMLAKIMEFFGPSHSFLPLPFIYLALSAAGAVYLAKRRDVGDIIVLAWLGCSIAGPLIVSELVAPISLERYFLQALPAYLLLISKIADAWARRGIFAVIASVLVLSSAYAVIDQPPKKVIEHWREEMAYVRSQPAPRKMVILLLYEPTKEAVRYYGGDGIELFTLKQVRKRCPEDIYLIDRNAGGIRLGKCEYMKDRTPYSDVSPMLTLLRS